MSEAGRLAAFRALAAGLDRIDREVYASAGKDPLEPILGGGNRDCRLAMFGRDPGRHEVIWGQPFVGVGGQKIRAGLFRAFHGRDLPDFESSLEVGHKVFWANIVPYKPLGNVVWSPAVRQAFRPLVQDLLAEGWRGTEVLAFGNEAIQWFAHDMDQVRAIRAHMDREDRYTRSFAVDVVGSGGAPRTVNVHPLPHPSPLNATWAPHFPGLLAARLAALGWGPSSWQAGTPGPLV
jgi:uracil-DNA glycosylase